MNGFLPLWGWALWLFLVGTEKGPPTGGQESMLQPQAPVGSACLGPLGWDRGQALVTVLTFVRTKVARGFPGGWEGMAGAASFDTPQSPGEKPGSVICA